MSLALSKVGSFGVTIRGFLFVVRLFGTRLFPLWFVAFFFSVFVTMSLVPCLEERIGGFSEPVFGISRFSACNNDTRDKREYALE